MKSHVGTHVRTKVDCYNNSKSDMQELH